MKEKVIQPFGRTLLWFNCATLVFTTFVLATEIVGSFCPMGAENYMTGAEPQQGVYTQTFDEHSRVLCN